MNLEIVSFGKRSLLAVGVACAALASSAVAQVHHESDWAVDVSRNATSITADIAGVRHSTQYSSGAFNYSGTLGATGWTPHLPYWWYQGNPAPNVDLDRVSILQNPVVAQVINGDVIAAEVDDEVEMPEFTVTDLRMEFALAMDSAGRIAGLGDEVSYPVQDPVMQAVFRSSGEDATAFVYSTLEGMGFREAPITELLAGEISFAAFRETWGSGFVEPPTEQEIKDALRDTKIKISIEGGASTDVLKVKVEIETNLWALDTLREAVKNGVSGAILRMVNFLKNNPTIRRALERQVPGFDMLWRLFEIYWD